MTNEIITRKEAKAIGLSRYFTGKPCKRGHLSERQTSNGSCLPCHVDTVKKYLSNPDNKSKHLQSKRRWNANNYEHRKEYGRAYRESDKVSHADRFRRWYYANASKRPEYAERMRSVGAKRRATKISAVPADFGEFDKFVIEEASRAAKRRERQHGKPFHVDHIIALAVGGLHAWHNIQVIPARLNCAKGARLTIQKPGEWVRYV